jgi:hypothetical protein
MVPPPWNFYSPFGTPKEAIKIFAAEYFVMANFTSMDIVEMNFERIFKTH